MKKEIKQFDAEISKVLKLVINSIYSNKDIFLRELISNASDACDKARYIALDSQKSDTNIDYKISISVSKDLKTLTVADNGIGMNKKELVENLGTIANSGTKNFLEQISKNSKNSELIGQFGVGFYSAFMVSDKVVVKTKKIGENAFIWSSDGINDYTIEESSDDIPHGTQVILHIKNSESEFLDDYRIKHIVKTYSDHIPFPIEFANSEGKFEIINEASALWMRNSSDIKQEEYEEFFRHVSHVPGKPWMTIHNKLEGVLEYTNLLFIPESKPFDLFNPDRKTIIKLYVNRVFISEGNNDLLPPYLRFMRGIVDSKDLPLNISRETLQNNHIIQKIKKSLVKKIFSSLTQKAKKSPEEYMKFFENFGEVLKEGLCGESTADEKENILQLCRFHSMDKDWITLDEYIEKMPSDQKNIYFLNGENFKSMKNHPQLEGFKRKNIDVLLLDDHVDNFWVNVVHKYKDIEFKSVSSENIELDKEDKPKNKYEDLTKLIKDVLGEKVKEVVISSKLINSPASIAIPEGSMNLRMEKFLMEQKQLHSKSAKIFEINPEHVIWKKVDLKNTKSDFNNNLINVLYSQACLIEGDTISDPTIFSAQLNDLLSRVKNH